MSTTRLAYGKRDEFAFFLGIDIFLIDEPSVLQSLRNVTPVTKEGQLCVNHFSAKLQVFQ